MGVDPFSMRAKGVGTNDAGCQVSANRMAYLIAHLSAQSATDKVRLSAAQWKERWQRWEDMPLME